MNSNNTIVRTNVEANFTPFKIEYLDPMDSGRIVSQTFMEQPPTKVHKINCNVVSSFPNIAIKNEDNIHSDRMEVSQKKQIYNPMDSGQIVSQTFMDQRASKVRKINCDVVNNFPKIAIKNEDNIHSDRVEVVLVNGCWDTSNKIPNIIAEMHTVNTEDFNSGRQDSLVFRNSSDSLNEARDFTSPSPKSSDSGIESDCTDGNLSWLLNYKIHELPPVPDSHISENRSQSSQPFGLGSGTFQHFVQVPRTVTEKNISSKEDDRSYKQFYRYSGPKKPPFTYTELIEYALCEKGELTVSGIYQWISDHFPFYKPNDDRWKNSVRHNLSINPHFRKGGKAVQGAGHLWTIAQRDDNKSWQIKQRMLQFLQSTHKDTKTREQEAFDKELQAATDSILGEIDRQTHKSDDLIETNMEGPDIEVEYINLGEVPTGLEDFLAPPVSKQDIVNECGLGNDFFITDINPQALGLNLVESEAISEDMYEDVFEYYELKK